MATRKPDSPMPLPDPAPRSEALEEELAMLEAILRLYQPSPADPPKDRGDTR
jgi:hypothetical protein